jgi:hypothetical protein
MELLNEAVAAPLTSSDDVDSSSSSLVVDGDLPN